jgi:hypothetical protein
MCQRQPLTLSYGDQQIGQLLASLDAYAMCGVGSCLLAQPAECLPAVSEGVFVWLHFHFLLI